MYSNDNIVLITAFKIYRESDRNLDLKIKNSDPFAFEIRGLLLERKRLIDHIGRGKRIMQGDYKAHSDIFKAVQEEENKLENIEKILSSRHREVMSRIKPGEY